MTQHYIHLDKIDSTNSYLLNLTSHKDIEDIVVYADAQYKGKGLGSNTWESEPMKNLTFSMAINSSFINITQQFRLSQTVAVALHKSLATILNHEHLYIKWPNDILFDSRKISGTLISNVLKNNMMHLSIIGVGINVNQTHFLDWPTNPISLKMITNSQFNIEDVLHSVVDNLNRNLDLLKRGGYNQINDYYISYLYRYNTWANYEVKGQIKKLFMCGLDEFGRLLLKDESSNIYSFDVKQIKFLHD